MTETSEREGVTFRCEDCGSTIENSPMRPATCVHCGGEFEAVADIDLPVLLTGVNQGDELRLRLGTGGFIEGRVTEMGHEIDADEVCVTLSGDGDVVHEVRADARDQLGEVTVAEIDDTGTVERRDLGRVVGVLNLTDHPDALDDHAEDRVVLVGCGDSKHDQSMPAQYLYSSTYFQKKRDYAEQPGVNAWYVLSAKYGLVHPDEQIEPYDTHIDDIDNLDDWSAFVQMQMPDLSGATIEFIAGEAYFEALDIALDFAAGSSGSVERPVEGLGIGEQMAWLKEHTTDDPDEDRTDVVSELTEADFPSVDELDAHGDPVHCGTCGRNLPGDPTLEVECPVCGAEPGTKCSRPSGHSGNFVHPHGDRDRLALATGITPPCPEGTDPMTPEESAEALGIECEIDETNPFDYQWPWFVDGVLDAEDGITTGEIDMTGGRAQHIPADDDPDGCVAIIDTTGEPCGNSTTTEASDTEARLCGTHAKASSVSRADAVAGSPDEDLRDALVEAGMSGGHAYYLATIEDSAADLWRLVTGVETVEQDEKVYEPRTLATLASTVARLEAVDAEGHPLAYDGCVAVIDVGARGKDYRCGSGGYANKLLCGTHQDTNPDNLRTVFDVDAPEDLRIDDWPEVCIGDDRFLAVEQRDGDLLTISNPEYEYRRLEGFGYLVDDLDTDAGAGRDEREGNRELTGDAAGDVQEASSEEIDDVPEPAFLDEHPKGSLIRVELEDGRVYTGEVVDHGTGGWRDDARSLYIDADAVRGSLMVYCDRQTDGSWGDLQALDKLIGAYDDPDAGEDALGPVASIEQIADEPDREGALEELVPLLEAGLSPSQALDYWVVEETETTHGAFTQKEWAEIRGVSRQAIGGNIGNARDVLSDNEAT